MPNEHAKLCTPSSSYRWLHCTAAPRYEAMFPNGTSVYAEEGTLAHSVCELKGQRRFNFISDSQCEKCLNALKKHELWNDEMLKCADFYADYLFEKSNAFKSAFHITFERRVDISDYVPGCFGTCDCIMIGDDNTLYITDYKHGKGVVVSAENNSQMMLYALGALKFYEPIYGGTIKRVHMAIVQPRITEDVSEFEMSIGLLKSWGETVVKPVAEKAYSGIGAEYRAGDWCRFCKGKSQCRYRAEYYAAFSEYIDSHIEGRLTEEEKRVLPAENIMTDDMIATLLDKAQDLEAWYSDLKQYALEAILSGKDITGWKVVEGRSNRAFIDADEAMDRMKKSGFDEAVLYDRKPKTLAQMEKLTGKKEFMKIMDGLIHIPKGKPTLVTACDRRPSYTVEPDASEFGG